MSIGFSNSFLVQAERWGKKVLDSFRRLLARPVTTLCIDCKEQSEREEAAAEQSGRGGIADLGDLGDGEGKSPGGLED